MPPKVNPKQRLEKTAYISEFGSEVFRTDGEILFCIPCGKGILGAVDKRYSVTQHLETQEHQRKVCRKRTSEQALLQDVAHAAVAEPKQTHFSRQLCAAFVEADIPLDKLAHPKLKAFLEGISHCDVPHPSTLRRNYLPKLFED